MATEIELTRTSLIGLRVMEAFRLALAADHGIKVPGDPMKVQMKSRLDEPIQLIHVHVGNNTFGWISMDLSVMPALQNGVVMVTYQGRYGHNKGVTWFGSAQLNELGHVTIDLNKSVDAA